MLVHENRIMCETFNNGFTPPIGMITECFKENCHSCRLKKGISLNVEEEDRHIHGFFSARMKY